MVSESADRNLKRCKRRGCDEHISRERIEHMARLNREALFCSERCSNRHYQTEHRERRRRERAATPLRRLSAAAIDAMDPYAVAGHRHRNLTPAEREESIRRYVDERERFYRALEIGDGFWLRVLIPTPSGIIIDLRDRP